MSRRTFGTTLSKIGSQKGEIIAKVISEFHVLEKRNSLNNNFTIWGQI